MPEVSPHKPPVTALQEKLEHLHFHEAPARCRSPCCSPLASLQQLSSLSERPAFNRKTTASSSKSIYSTGTDGSSLEQSDKEAILAGHPDVIDMNVFEQVFLLSLLTVGYVDLGIRS